jgi:hypothetical protein
MRAALADHHAAVRQWIQVLHDVAEAQRELEQAELLASGADPEQLRPYFEGVLVGVVLLVVLPLLLLTLVALFG